MPRGHENKSSAGKKRRVGSSVRPSVSNTIRKADGRELKVTNSKRKFLKDEERKRE